ncbi:uncharacterized protein Z519_12367 [Cladophialophora bantiana CBS 173.52]|uniref:DNA-directed RNA polymerases I, II, and III subunit RPABC5 n=1 Tax=Cladophialophora bantiana (strain ATCC 10958 / CBS 173.52 / CDC B-1940 / NIH 8579) TaxID=1442370 RepID=A0A0D2H888_CLAB1|nr:uncharacterized protein Z519_12367 [Cladophialophora bantiana CBS 173.52]KIW87070.1 hypothetical protein Z519_12367 [Cladophialophora bantiana CBS 173.52]
MDQVGAKRYCCRRMLMTHVDLIEKLLQYVGDICFAEDDDGKDDYSNSMADKVSNRYDPSERRIKTQP